VSKENVEIVRRLYSQTERGNFWVPEFFDPNVRIVWLEAIEFDRDTVGIEAMARGIKAWLDPYEGVTLTADRLVEAGDQVVAHAVWRGRGRGSGAVTEWPHGSVWALEGGRVSSVVSYTEPRDAFEAAGIPESA
jgi:ketosteroid isomerase-like protein